MVKQLSKKAVSICILSFSMTLLVWNLVLAIGETTVAKWRDDKTGAFSMNFDDSTKSHADFVIPHFNAHGFVGTFFVNPDRYRYRSRLKTWEKIAPKYGQGLANHTMNHSGASSYEHAEYEIGRCSKEIWKIYPDKSKLLPFARGGGTVWTVSSEEIDKLKKKYFCYNRWSTSMTNKSGEEMIAFVKAALDEGEWKAIHFHGVGPRGEYLNPKTPESFDILLDYMETVRDKLWNGEWNSVYKYTKERDDAQVKVLKAQADNIQLTVDTPGIEAELYDEPLTLITNVPSGWKYFAVEQGKTRKPGKVRIKNNKSEAVYNIMPNRGKIALRKVTDLNSIVEIKESELPDIFKTREHVKNKLLEGLKPRSLIDLEGNVMSYVYSGKNPIAAAWYEGGEKSRIITINNISQISNIYDNEGNNIEINRNNPSINIKLTSKPVYVKGKDIYKLEDCFLFCTDVEAAGNRILKISMDLMDTGKTIKMVFKNVSHTKSYDGECIISLPSGVKKTTKIKLSPQESKVDLVILDWPHGETFKLEVSHKEDGKVYTDTEEFSFVIAKKLNSKITVDGNLDGWSGMNEYKVNGEKNIFEKGNEWRGTEDCSYTFSIGYDKKAIYIAVNVTDDQYQQTYKEENMWRNDCLELFLDMDNSDNGEDFYTDDDFQILLSQQSIDDKKKLFAGYTGKPGGKGSHQKLIDKTKTAILHKKGGYTMELSIPWKLLHNFKPKSGEKIGFNIAVDDSDRESNVTIDKELKDWTEKEELTGRKYQMGWIDSKFNSDTPTTFGLLFLE